MIWTVLFVVAVMVLGCVLFSVHDWGSPSGNRGRRTRMRDCGGVVHGPYLPPCICRTALSWESCEASRLPHA